MSNNDGKVTILIETNGDKVVSILDEVQNSFDNTGKSANRVASVFDSMQSHIDKNVKVLRDMALGGNANTEKFKALAQQTKEYKMSLEDANNAVSKAIKTQQEQISQTNKLETAVKGLVGAYLGVQGIRALINYSAQAVESFRTQERAVLSLNNTLQNAGVYSYEYSQSLQQLASEIQSYSNYGDEAIIKAQALGQAYVGNIKITKELTKATVDFAAATGMDLEQAFTLVGKSIGSNTNALGRYGVELHKGMTETEKMDSIQRQLGQRFDGTARQMANSSIQLKNALGDLSEAFGRALDPAVSTSQKWLISITNSLTELINRVRVARTEIHNLGIEDLQAKLRQNWVEQDKLGQKQKFYSKHSNTPAGQLRSRKFNAQEQALKEQEAAIQKRLNDLYASEKKLAQASQLKGYKINDDYGIASSINTPKISSRKTQTTVIKDEYEKLQSAVAGAKREIELAAIAHGTSSEEVQKAFVRYRELNEQLQSINSLFDVEKVKTEEQKGAYQQLTDRISDLTQKLRDLAAENQIGSEDWVKYKQDLVNAQTELNKVNQSLTDSGVKLEDYGKQISSSISSGLVNALRNGGNAFDAFSSLATSALQKVLDKLIEISIIEPIIKSIKGGANGASGGLFGFIGSLFGFKDGGAFQNGNVIPFAKGGIVNKPILFPMANGGTGLMGEAGAEAVMPLKRMKNGKLGVEAYTSKNNQVVNIYNYSGASVETRRKDDNTTEIFIRRVNDALANERTQSGFKSAYSMANNKGVQAV